MVVYLISLCTSYISTKELIDIVDGNSAKEIRKTVNSIARDLENDYF